MAKTLPQQVPTPNTSPTSSELLYLVSDPYGTPADDAATAANIITKAHGISNTPALGVSGGVIGAATTTGSGAVVLASGPTLVAPVLGTPASGVATNLTGTAPGLTAGNVTTNANLTGPITSSGNATSIASQTGTGTKFVVDTSPTIAGHITVEGVTATGATGTGNFVFDGSPTLTTAVLGSSTATTQTPADNSTKIATTAYVDLAVLGQNFKEAAKYASVTVLPTIVYSSGAGTLTGFAAGALSLDGNSPAANDRVLIKNQASTFQNGIYTVTATGSGIAVFVLTRTSDANTSVEFKTGDSIFVTAGSTLATTTWAYTGVDSPNFTSDAITYAQVAGQGSFTGGNGISITGTSIAINTSVTVDKTTAQVLTNKDLTSGTNTFPTFTAAAGTLTGTILNATVVTSSLTSVGTLGGLTVTAAPTFSAMTAGSALFAGTAGLLSQDNANYAYDSTNHNLRIGQASATITTENRLAIMGNANDYHGTLVSNINSGTTASTDMVVANDLTSDPMAYFDFGVNSSGNTNASATLFGASDAYIFTGAGGGLNNINIATGTAGKVIKFGVGGILAANEIARFYANGLGIGTTSPTAVAHVVGTTPASVATTPGTTAPGALTVTGGAGGATTIATTGTAGSGSAMTLTLGAGGLANAALTAGTAGNGGAFTLTTGAGGASAISGGATGNAGNGGSITFNASNGGAATLATTTNGGDGGGITFKAGAGGAGTTTNGNAGVIIFQTSLATAAQVTRLTLGANLTFANAVNIILNTTTGTQLATGATQKLGFWGTAPVVQPTSAATGAAFVVNTGTAVNTGSTFGGYTLAKLVGALQLSGVIA